MLAAARGEQKGGFKVELFRRALAAALGGAPTASGELLGVLTAKYMAFADVRWASRVSDGKQCAVRLHTASTLCTGTVRHMVWHTDQQVADVRIILLIRVTSTPAGSPSPQTPLHL